MLSAKRSPRSLAARGLGGKLEKQNCSSKDFTLGAPVRQLPSSADLIALARKPLHCRLAIYLLGRVESEPCQQFLGNDSITLSPGQIATTRSELARDLISSEQRIRTALRQLKEIGLISCSPNRNCTVISLNFALSISCSRGAQ